MANAIGRHHGALTCIWPFPVPAYSSNILLQIARTLHLGASQGCTSWRTWRLKVKRHLGEPQPGWTDGWEVWRKPLEEKENPLKRGPCPLASGSPADLCPKSQDGNLLGTVASPGISSSPVLCLGCTSWVHLPNKLSHSPMISG